MISLETARKLKNAGLEWLPAINDFFAVPEREMDERVFVINDIQATMDKMQGNPVIAFQGASEWALDNLLTDEVVWLPSEEQLRKALEAVLVVRGEFVLSLESNLDGCRCLATVQDQALQFRANDGSEAYAAALLHFLEAQPPQS